MQNAIDFYTEKYGDFINQLYKGNKLSGTCTSLLLKRGKYKYSLLLTE